MPHGSNSARHWVFLDELDCDATSNNQSPIICQIEAGAENRGKLQSGAGMCIDNAPLPLYNAVVRFGAGLISPPAVKAREHGRKQPAQIR